MKIAVIASGWHYACQFYRAIAAQRLCKDLHVDLFVISHRHPEHPNVISEKEDVRNYTGNNLLMNLDKELYRDIITEDELRELGWKYIEKPNTIGDMEVFNQWSDDYDYKEYDIFLITHDDNLILSTDIFIDILDKHTKLYKPIIESRYGQSGHQFKTELINNNLDWLFLDNGYSEYIPKAFTPRGSFSFYMRELIDKLPNNKFSMEGITVTREGETDSPDYNAIAGWNTNAGNFRNFLYEGYIEKTRWLSDTKRVSCYCIEGERGFIHNNNSNEIHYERAVLNLVHL